MLFLDLRDARCAQTVLPRAMVSQIRASTLPSALPPMVNKLPATSTQKYANPPGPLLRAARQSLPPTQSRPEFHRLVPTLSLSPTPLLPLPSLKVVKPGQFLPDLGSATRPDHAMAQETSISPSPSSRLSPTTVQERQALVNLRVLIPPRLAGATGTVQLPPLRLLGPVDQLILPTRLLPGAESIKDHLAVSPEPRPGPEDIKDLPLAVLSTTHLRAPASTPAGVLGPSEHRQPRLLLPLSVDL